MNITLISIILILILNIAIVLFYLIRCTITLNNKEMEAFKTYYKPILFMHFHKAGGTTINDMANELKKFPQNKNGNPYMNGKLLRFWEFKNKDFENFKKYIKMN